MSITDGFVESGRTGSRIIESKSISYVPVEERYGRPRDLGVFWFGSNLILIFVITGGFFAAPHFGFAWSVFGIILGIVLGTFVAAFHAAQGPRIGMPQMIQSRAQFGYVGAIIPMLIAVVVFVVFYGSGAEAAAQLANAGWGVSTWVMIAVMCLLSTAVAIVGYRFTHSVARVSAVVSGLTFLVFTILLLSHVGISHALPINWTNGFSLSFFVEIVSITFVFEAGYAVMIADYTRYLPANSSTVATGLWTFLGLAVSGAWLFLLGAYLGAVSGNPDTAAAILEVVGHAGRVFVYVFLTVQIFVTLINISFAPYAGANTLLACAQSFRPRSGIAASLRNRLVALIPLSVVCTATAFIYNDAGFQSAFTNALDVTLILVVPWSMVNLCDFYLVRKGLYVPEDIDRPNGRYGMWNWRGIGALAVAIAVELPFASLGTLYTGPLSKSLVDGSDLSWIVGAVVAAVCYYGATLVWGADNIRPGGAEPQLTGVAAADEL